MRMRRLSFAILAIFGATGAVLAQESGRDATRSLVTVVDADGRSKRVVLDSPRRFDAPGWSPDGSSLILNAGGKIWRVAVDGDPTPRAIPTGLTGWSTSTTGSPRTAGRWRSPPGR